MHCSQLAGHSWRHRLLIGSVLVLTAHSAGFPAAAAATTGASASAVSDLRGLSLEDLMEIEVVQAASRYEQSLLEAPSAVSIITREEIEAHGYRNLAELLDGTRGVFTTNDRNYEYAGIRGFGRPGDYNTRMLLLLNGHRLNDNVYDSAAIGEELVLDLGLVERVEFIRGPASSMYGSSAFFGVVNIVTLEGEALDGLRLSSEAGSFETLGVQVDYGKRFDNGIDVLASASGFDREGQALYFSEFDDPETNYGWAEDSDKEHAERYFLQATSGGFSLQAASSSREKRIPTAPWETVFNDPRTSTVDRWDVLSLEYSRAAEEDRFGFLGRISHNRYDYTGDYLYDYGEDDEPYLVVNKDSASGRWWGAEFELVRRYKDGRIFIAGAEYRDNFRQNQKNEDEEVYTDESRSSHSLGLFVHAELPLTDKLKLSAGLRHDGGDQTEDSLSPKAALIWAPAEDRALKLLYGRAFRSPNAYELYFDEVETLEEPLPGSQKRPLDLFAEEITTEELVWEQRVGSHWRGLLSLYHYEINDLISLTTDPADGLLVFDNLGRVEARGVEAEVEGWWRGGLRTRWSYAYQEAEAAGAGRRLSNSPRHVTKMQLRRWFWDERLQAATDIRHSSGRLTPGDQLVTAHTVANLSLTARLPHDRLGMTLSFYNLFAERYADPGSEEHLQEQLQQDGRSWRLSLTYRP